MLRDCQHLGIQKLPWKHRTIFHDSMVWYKIVEPHFPLLKSSTPAYGANTVWPGECKISKDFKLFLFLYLRASKLPQWVSVCFLQKSAKNWVKSHIHSAMCGATPFLLGDAASTFDPHALSQPSPGLHPSLAPSAPDCPTSAAAAGWEPQGSHPLPDTCSDNNWHPRGEGGTNGKRADWRHHRNWGEGEVQSQVKRLILKDVRRPKQVWDKGQGSEAHHTKRKAV